MQKPSVSCTDLRNHLFFVVSILRCKFLSFHPARVANECDKIIGIVFCARSKLAGERCEGDREQVDNKIMSRS